MSMRVWDACSDAAITFQAMHPLNNNFLQLTKAQFTHFLLGWARFNLSLHVIPIPCLVNLLKVYHERLSNLYSVKPE